MANLSAQALIAKLALVDENILADAARQPLLFINAARYRVSTMRRRATASAALDAGRASLALRIRAKKEGDGGKKFTEAALKEKLENHSAVRALRADLDRAYEGEEFSKLILEAYRMRRDAIRVIAESQNIEGMRGGHEVERAEQNKKLRSRARRLEEQRRYLEAASPEDE